MAHKKSALTLNKKHLDLLEQATSGFDSLSDVSDDDRSLSPPQKTDDLFGDLFDADFGSVPKTPQLSNIADFLEKKEYLADNAKKKESKSASPSSSLRLAAKKPDSEVVDEEEVEEPEETGLHQDEAEQDALLQSPKSTAVETDVFETVGSLVEENWESIDKSELAISEAQSDILSSAASDLVIDSNSDLPVIEGEAVALQLTPHVSDQSLHLSDQLSETSAHTSSQPDLNSTAQSLFVDKDEDLVSPPSEDFDDEDFSLEETIINWDFTHIGDSHLRDVCNKIRQAETRKMQSASHVGSPLKIGKSVLARAHMDYLGDDPFRHLYADALLRSAKRESDQLEYNRRVDESVRHKSKSMFRSKSNHILTQKLKKEIEQVFVSAQTIKSPLLFENDCQNAVQTFIMSRYEVSLEFIETFFWPRLWALMMSHVHGVFSLDEPNLFDHQTQAPIGVNKSVFVKHLLVVLDRNYFEVCAKRYMDFLRDKSRRRHGHRFEVVHPQIFRLAAMTWSHFCWGRIHNSSTRLAQTKSRYQAQNRAESEDVSSQERKGNSRDRPQSAPKIQNRSTRVYSRLYDESQKKRKQKMSFAKRMAEMKLEQEQAECTFRPNLNSTRDYPRYKPPEQLQGSYRKRKSKPEPSDTKESGTYYGTYARNRRKTQPL